MERGILIDRSSPIPLQKQLEDALRSAILSGRLEPGERLLASREFQKHLGLSRNTVVNALGQLHAEGYLVTRRGIGTFVAAHVQVRNNDVRREYDPVVPSNRAQRYLDVESLAANLEYTAPFRPGMPALDMFPGDQFRRALRTATIDDRDLLDYASPYGHSSLREAIAKRLGQTRGIVCSSDDILITNGAQAAFSLIARVMLSPRDLVIVEDPGYANVRAVMIGEGAKVLGVPIDGDGIIVRSFESRRARLVCVTPSHQYPTGAVLSLDRRFRLLDWASKQDAWIVEDDYDSEFNFTNHPQPALQGLSGGGRVIYVGTFSKVLSPSLRVAYMVVPRSLRASFQAVHVTTGGPPSSHMQKALATFIEAGWLGRHVSKMRSIYDERRRFVHERLKQRANGRLEIHDSRAGLHFIAALPEHISDVAVSRRASKRGLTVPALSEYHYTSPKRNGLVIGYAATPVSAADAAIQNLVDCL